MLYITSSARDRWVQAKRFARNANLTSNWQHCVATLNKIGRGDDWRVCVGTNYTSLSFIWWQERRVNNRWRHLSGSPKGELTYHHSVGWRIHTLVGGYARAKA